MSYHLKLQLPKSINTRKQRIEHEHNLYNWVLWLTLAFSWSLNSIHLSGMRAEIYKTVISAKVIKDASNEANHQVIYLELHPICKEKGYNEIRSATAN